MKKMTDHVELTVTLRIVGTRDVTLAEVTTTESRPVGMLGRGNTETYAPAAVFRALDGIRDRIAVAGIAAVAEETGS